MSGPNGPAVDEPTVGVVMPVRDNAGTVAAALNSVVSQVPRPRRVAVIDGGSTDGTAEIAAAVVGVDVIAQVGRGLGAARNQGLAALATDLVAFCDGDDRWTPGSLRVRIDHLVAHADCDAVIGHYVVEELDPPVRVDPSAAGRRPALTPGGLLVRRGVLDRVGPFADHLAIGTDSDWFVRLRQSGARVDVLDDIVLVKGRRSTSLSTDVVRYRRELLEVARGFLRRERQQ